MDTPPQTPANLSPLADPAWVAALPGWLPPAALLLLHAALGLWGGPLMVGSDDLAYASLGNIIQQGGYFFAPSPFFHRFLQISPVAALYALGGVNLHTTVAWSFLCSAALVGLVYLAGLWLQGRTTAWWGGMLAATSPIGLEHALHLNVDMTLTLFLFATVLVAVRGRQQRTTRQERGYGLLLALVFTLGFLSKEFILWLIPPLLVVMVQDVRHGRRRTFWLWATVSGLLLAAAYFLMYALLTGDPMARQAAIEFNQTQYSPSMAARWSYHDKEWPVILDRLTLAPLRLILRTPSYALLLVLTLPLLARYPAARRLAPNLSPLWGAIVLIILAFIWFSSTSLRYYNPPQLMTRTFLGITPFLYLLGGALLAHIFATADPPRPEARPLALYYLASLPLLWLLQNGLGAYKYLTLTVGGPIALASGWLWLPHSWRRRAAPLLGLLCCAGMVAGAGITIDKDLAGEGPEQGGIRHAVQKLQQQPQPLRIYAEHRSTTVLAFYHGFNVPRQVEILSWNKVQPEAAPDGRRTLFFFNRHRFRDLAHLATEAALRQASGFSGPLRQVAQNNQVYLFEATSGGH